MPLLLKNRIEISHINQKLKNSLKQAESFTLKERMNFLTKKNFYLRYGRVQEKKFLGTVKK